MSEKITFKELVNLIAEQSQQSQSSTSSFISELVGVIEGGLGETGSVSISGFGKFELRWMKERTGTHPQTGESITIPGQNKVYFKPFKALREEVNRPYSNLEAQVLEDENDESEEKDLPSDIKSEPAPVSGKDPTESKPPEPEIIKKEEAEPEPEPNRKPAASIPLGPPPEIEDEDNGDHLLIERPVPHDASKMGKMNMAFLPKRDEKQIPDSLFSKSKSEEDETEKEKPSAAIPVSTASAPESKKSGPVKRDVRKTGSYNWAYTAVAIILIVAIVALFYFMQQDDEVSTPQIAGQQQEQLADPPGSAAEEVTEQPADDSSPFPAGEPDPDADREPDTEASDSSSQNVFNTVAHTVEQGESLWSIAEFQMTDPYLWPVIYKLNRSLTDNPNLIPSEAELSVPSISDPENLNPDQLEQVALGYLSVYNWAVTHQPDNARYFLWAVGVYSGDVLANAEERADPDDWRFANTR